MNRAVRADARRERKNCTLGGSSDVIYFHSTGEESGRFSVHPGDALSFYPDAEIGLFSNTDSTKVENESRRPLISHAWMRIDVSTCSYSVMLY